MNEVLAHFLTVIFAQKHFTFSCKNIVFHWGHILGFMGSFFHRISILVVVNVIYH